MEQNLSLFETRVLGCLFEKAVTTPDYYPLTSNGLLSACNQKSNREPVLEMTDSELQTTLDELNKKRLVTVESGFGSRVNKYAHRFCNTEFGELKLSKAELAIVCVLFLRGAQTPGELRTRTQRLHEFADVAAVEATLESMAQRATPLVQKLARQAGKREHRYVHLFSELSDEAVTVGVEREVQAHERTKIAELEQEVSQLKAQVALLQQQLANAQA